MRCVRVLNRACGRLRTATFTVLALGLLSGRLAAQERVADSNGDGMDTHLFRPAVDSKGFFSVNGSDIVGAGDLSFGLILDYGRSLLRTNPEREEPGVKALVTHSFQGSFSFNYGISDLLVVGIKAPVLMMTGDAAQGIGPTDATYDSGQLDVQNLGSPSIHGKLRLLRVEQGLGAAVVLQLGAPLSGAERQLGAEPGVWYWPSLVLEKDAGSSRWFKFALNGGFRGHTGSNPEFGMDAVDASLPQLEEGELTYGNLATFGAGVSLRALRAMDLVVESYGTYLLDDHSDDRQKLSQEFVGGIKLFIEQNSYFMMGGGARAFSTGFQAADARLILGFVFEPSIGDRDGDGLKDDEDQCPDEAEDFDGFEDSDGCPEPDNDQDGIPDDEDRCPDVAEDMDNDEDGDGCPELRELDSDGDGIIDSKDRCPNEPEDRDGYQDSDGCPDLDNDKDGIPDTRDACPLDKEDKDGFEDEDGCPDFDNDKDQIPDTEDKCPMEPERYNGIADEDGCPDGGGVVIEGSSLVTLDQIQFERGSAQISPESLPLLEEIATILREHPEFELIEVAGHADERGSDAYNLQLTKTRARAVLQALAKRGISSSRLLSQGYGEYCPLDDASSEEAWERNRRVDFQIVKKNGTSTGVDRGCRTASERGVTPPKAD